MGVDSIKLIPPIVAEINHRIPTKHNAFGGGFLSELSDNLISEDWFSPKASGFYPFSDATTVFTTEALVDLLTRRLPKNGVFWGLWLIRVNFVIFFGECYAI